jgi:hypothetical protein
MDSEKQATENPNSKPIVITANIGGIDNPKPFVKQSVEFERRYITSVDALCINYSDRIRAKYPKICSHEIYPNDTHIWIDASVEVKSPDFVKYMQEQLEGYDVAIGAHPFRKSAYEEVDFILAQLKSGNKYLNARYDKVGLMRTRDWLHEIQLPENSGLWACGIFARKNTPKVNASFEEWWEKVLQFDTVDQPSFAGIAYKHGLKINSIHWNTIFENQYFKLHSHDKQI